MTKFTATPEQVQQIAVNAIEASSPMGMGHLNFRATDKFIPSHIQFSPGGLNLDYVRGRMVKLRLQKLNEEGTEWQINPRISVDYQSWMSKYATVEDLLTSVPGVKIIIQQEIPDEPA